MERCLILSGAPGVGKSTVAAEVARILAERGVAFAFIDVDTIAQFGPAPRSHQDGLSFYDTLKAQNVGALWANFRSAGAQRLVVAASINSSALRARYGSALEGCEVQVALLVVPPGSLYERLAARQGDQFHPKTHGRDGKAGEDDLHRAAMAQERLQGAGVEGFAVINDSSVAQTAAAVLDLSGWLSPAAGR